MEGDSDLVSEPSSSQKLEELHDEHREEDELAEREVRADFPSKGDW